MHLPEPRFEHHEETHAPGRFALATLIVIVIGGGVGALTRYGVEQANPAGSDNFPIGTFLANAVGAFGLGLLLAYLAGRSLSKASTIPWYVKPMIGTGFFGAFTTYSTFAVEVVTRVRDDYLLVAAVYAVVTILVGFTMATIGYTLGKRFGSDGEAAS